MLRSPPKGDDDTTRQRTKAAGEPANRKSGIR